MVPRWLTSPKQKRYVLFFCINYENYLRHILSFSFLFSYKIICYFFFELYFYQDKYMYNMKVIFPQKVRSNKPQIREYCIYCLIICPLYSPWPISMQYVSYLTKSIHFVRKHVTYMFSLTSSSFLFISHASALILFVLT